MKKTFTIDTFINNDIKVGDKVFLIDGSAFTCMSNELDNEVESIYIICSYPKLTGSDKIIKEIVAEVLEVGISNKCCSAVCNKVYLQDIIVQIGTGKFRTASKLVMLKK